MKYQTSAATDAAPRRLGGEVDVLVFVAVVEADCGASGSVMVVGTTEGPMPQIEEGAGCAAPMVDDVADARGSCTFFFLAPGAASDPESAALRLRVVGLAVVGTDGGSGKVRLGGAGMTGKVYWACCICWPW